MQSAFATIKFQPFKTRGEHVNIGLIFWRSRFDVDVRLSSNLRKAKALDGNTSLHNLQKIKDRIPDFIKEMQAFDTLDAQLGLIKNLFPYLTLSQADGLITYHSEQEYERKVEMMMQSIVEPSKKKNKQRTVEQTKLIADIKMTFDFYGWLGQRKQDIDNHMVVHKYPLDDALDMTADFALMNGRLNVIEVVDLRSGLSTPKRNEVRSKALIYDFAKHLDNKGATGYSVIAGAQDNVDAKPYLNLLERYADDVFHYEAVDDMNLFIHKVSKALDRPILEIPLN